MSELGVSPVGHPSLAVITLGQGGDGVAYAALLLYHALTEIARRPRVLALNPKSSSEPSLLERVRFSILLAAAQLSDSDGSWIFGHVAIARVQTLIPRVLRRPYAVLLCGIEVWDPALAADRRKTLKLATSRIAISKFTADRVNSVHPEVGRVSICPLALLPRGSELAVYDQDLVAKVAEPSVLIVGRMNRTERYKGHDELLECWPLVLQQVPDAQLVIAGRGDDVERLRSKAGELGVATNVLFTGFVSDATLEVVRKRVSLFALPSRGEGFGLVYLEAMRAGLPCIGGTEDAARDVIVHGETGLLANPRNRIELARSIVRLLQSRELSAAYGAAGKRRFEEVFTFPRYCERLRTVLESDFA